MSTIVGISSPEWRAIVASRLILLNPKGITRPNLQDPGHIRPEGILTQSRLLKRKEARQVRSLFTGGAP
jgi:hypothetical protein